MTNSQSLTDKQLETTTPPIRVQVPIDSITSFTGVRFIELIPATPKQIEREIRYMQTTSKRRRAKHDKIRQKNFNRKLGFVWQKV